MNRKTLRLGEEFPTPNYVFCISPKDDQMQTFDIGVPIFVHVSKNTINQPFVYESQTERIHTLATLYTLNYILKKKNNVEECINEIREWNFLGTISSCKLIKSIGNKYIYKVEYFSSGKTKITDFWNLKAKISKLSLVALDVELNQGLIHSPYSKCSEVVQYKRNILQYVIIPDINMDTEINMDVEMKYIGKAVVDLPEGILYNSKCFSRVTNLNMFTKPESLRTVHFQKN